MTALLRQPKFPRRAAQQGVVLVIALIFLVLLTLIAIAASSGSLLQQRMVAATRSAQLAVMSGNTALRGAEWQIWNTTVNVSATFICGTDAVNATTGCVEYNPESAPYTASGAVTEFRTGDNKWLTTGIEYKGAAGSGYTSLAVANDYTASPNVAENPRYIIEDMGQVHYAGTQGEGGTTGTGGAANSIIMHAYRITARATGGTQNVVRVVQSTFDAQVHNH